MTFEAGAFAARLEEPRPVAILALSLFHARRTGRHARYGEALCPGALAQRPRGFQPLPDDGRQSKKLDYLK